MADQLTLDFEKSFPTGVVIGANLQAAIGDGEILVLFGPSGSGKTTILRSIAGLERPERGTISFAGEEWLDAERGRFAEPQRRGTAYVFQEAALFPHLTVRRNIEYGIDGLAPAERIARGNELVELLALQTLADWYPRQLSGGQAQRVALARALARHPRLLLLDEPFAALDTPTRVQLRRLLRRSIERLTIAVVLVTHDRAEAMALGDQMAVLADGKIRQVGSVVDVFRRPADLAVARSVGVESVLPARVAGTENGMLELRVGDVLLRAASPEAESNGVAADIRSATPSDCREVFACIRAEDVSLERGPSAGASARNHLPCRVVGIETEGAVERVTIDCGFPLAALVTRQAREEMQLRTGSEVVAAIKATAIHVVPRS
jgi:molybdate transport system ATP-binding protein